MSCCRRAHVPMHLTVLHAHMQRIWPCLRAALLAARGSVGQNVRRVMQLRSVGPCRGPMHAGKVGLACAAEGLAARVREVLRAKILCKDEAMSLVPDACSSYYACAVEGLAAAGEGGAEGGALR